MPKQIYLSNGGFDNETELREIRTSKNIYNEELQEKLETEMGSTGSSHM